MSWKRTKLVDLAECIDYGHTASAVDDRVGPKFLRITDIQDGRVQWDGVPYCECSIDKLDKYRLRPGDIVFARTGATTGKSYLIKDCPPDTVFASYLIRVRPNQRYLSPSFLAYYFQTSEYWARISQTSSGTTSPGVNSTKLKDLSIPVPPLPIQRRIAAVLDKADALRRKRRRALDKLDELLQAVFLDMFGDPVTNPKEWPTLQLCDCIEEITAGWSAKGEDRKRESTEWGVLKISSVTSGRFLPSECKVVDDIPTVRRIVIPKKGDLLFSRANTRELVAATCLVERDETHLFLPDKLWRIDLNKNKMTSEFLRFLLTNQKYRDQITRKATGTSGSMLNISKKKLVETFAPVPPMHLQSKFSAEVWRVFNQRTMQETSLSKVEDLFNALMQKAFKGKLTFASESVATMEQEAEDVTSQLSLFG